MVYIPLNENLLDHPKTQKACRRLGIAEVQLVGHLSALWLWCLSYAEDGNLSDYEPEEVAAAARWKDDPHVFIAALVECGRKGGQGFLESPSPGTLIVHDYDEYVGKLIDRRKANAERMRQSRTGQQGAPAKQPGGGARTQTVPDTSLTLPLTEQDTCGPQIETENEPTFFVQDTCSARVELDKQSIAKQSKEEQSEDNNNQEERSAEERNTPPTSFAAASAADHDVVVASLRELGVSDLVAEDLTLRRGTEFCAKQIEYLPYRVAERAETPKAVRDPAALLVKSIEDRYAPPASFSQQKKAAADKERHARQQKEHAAQQEANRKAQEVGAARMQSAWCGLAEERRAALTEEVTLRFARRHKEHAKKHAEKLRDDPLAMPFGIGKLWRDLRDELLLEHGLVEVQGDGLVAVEGEVGTTLNGLRTNESRVNPEGEIDGN